MEMSQLDTSSILGIASFFHTIHFCSIDCCFSVAPRFATVTPLHLTMHLCGWDVGLVCGWDVGPVCGRDVRLFCGWCQLLLWVRCQPILWVGCWPVSWVLACFVAEMSACFVGGMLACFMSIGLFCGRDVSLFCGWDLACFVSEMSACFVGNMSACFVDEISALLWTRCQLVLWMRWWRVMWMRCQPVLWILTSFVNEMPALLWMLVCFVDEVSALFVDDVCFVAKIIMWMLVEHHISRWALSASGGKYFALFSVSSASWQCMDEQSCILWPRCHFVDEKSVCFVYELLLARFVDDRSVCLMDEKSAWFMEGTDMGLPYLFVLTKVDCWLHGRPFCTQNLGEAPLSTMTCPETQQQTTTHGTACVQ